MISFLEKINGFVWGVPALVMILGVGLYLSIRTGFAQLRLFPAALRAFCEQFKSRKDVDGVSGYQALCTALAATVGTGNLAGVAGAIAIGGPGAIFWMWICAFFGMVTKFAEATLAIRFRQKNESDEYVGGPMYMIRNGMGKRWNWLAALYCFFGVVASFGVGNATQVNAVLGGIDAVANAMGCQLGTGTRILLGIMLAMLICVLLLGGAKRIGSAAEKIVPVAALGYLLLGVFVLIACADRIPDALLLIISGALNPKAVTGGVVGSVFVVLRVGAARGVFTNEAGMGTAAIAHAGAKVEHPIRQGLMGIMEVFIDTIVICTMTALVILCSGVPISYGNDVGIALTTDAFSSVCGKWISIPIAVALCFFALATILGWGLYGIRCAQYLFGYDVWKRFAYLQGITVVIGSVLGTGTVWMLAEIINGFMAIPNLVALAWLTPELVKLLNEGKVYAPDRNDRARGLF